MNTLRPTIFAAAMLAVVVACDHDELLEEATPAPAPDGADGGAPPPDADAALADAKTGGDATNDEPSNCSHDGFCWTKLPAGQTLRGVWSDAVSSAWAVSAQGNVLRWDGTSWTIAWTAPGALFTIWGSSSTDLWVGGEKGLFHGQGSTPGTITWTPTTFDASISASIPVLDIAGSGPSDVWAIGSAFDFSTSPSQQRSVVRHYTGGDASSEDAWPVDPISYRPGLFRKILVRPNGDAWICGDRDGQYPTPPAYVLRRESVEGGGMTWTEQTIPFDNNDLFTRVDGAGFVGNGLRVVGWRGVRSRVTSMLVGSVSGPTGETWTEDASLVTVYSHFAIWGRAANDIYLAGSFGRFRHFDGTAWNLVRISIDGLPVTNDFRAMAINPENELWVVGNEIALHKKLVP